MTLDLALQIITLALVVFVPLAWKHKPSLWATLGVVAYTFSYLLSNLWQVALWTLEPPAAYGLALRLYQQGTLLIIVFYVGIIFYGLTKAGDFRHDMQAKLVWLVLLIAETFGALEYAECKMLIDPFGSGDYLLSQVWGIEVSRFACGRAFGYLTPYAAPIITSLYLILVNIKARRDGLPLL